MKTSLYSFIMFVCILGCNPNEKRDSAAQADSTALDNSSLTQDGTGSADSDSTEGVTMTVSPNTFKKGTVGEARLTLTNNGSTEITFGEPYSVEYNHGGTWQKVTLFDNIMFTMIAHALAPGESREFPINLQPVPYEYKAGEYRILKDVNAGDKKIPLTANFSVE